MIIDSLTHITPDGRWFNTSHDAGVERLLYEMDRAGVEKSIVVPLAGYIENEFVRKTCDRFPDRLIAGASINPMDFPDQTSVRIALMSILEDESFKVLKLHPRLHGYDPLDPRCLVVFETVSGLDRPVPVWLDSIFRSQKCLLSKPPVDIIHELALRFPNQTIVLLHSCGAQMLELGELVGSCENLVLDLSLSLLYYGTSSLKQDVEFLLQKRDLRVIAGSDFPEYTPSQYLKVLTDCVDQGVITPDKFNHIAGENISKIIINQGWRS